MFPDLLRTLFALDQPFVELRENGLPPEVRAALETFWSTPERATLKESLPLTADDLPALVAGLQEIGNGQRRSGSAATWETVAREAEALAEREPIAAALIALQAQAAWVGLLGPNLFHQPGSGHHPGWHVFPLSVARCLLAAEAIWAARSLCETAGQFVEAAKGSGYDPVLRDVIGEYRRLLTRADAIRDAAVTALAWELRSATENGEDGLRSELAALFWTSGDALRGRLLGVDGDPRYRPPLKHVRDLVDLSMRRIPHDPLLQHIWLEMKDRGPVNLRDHRVLFGLINNYYGGHPLHQQETLMSMPICRSFAGAAVGWMRGDVQPDNSAALTEVMSLLGPIIRGAAPDAYLRIGTLLTHLVDETDAQRRGHWRALAGLAAGILDWSNRGGLIEPYDRVLDLPFAELESGELDALRSVLDLIEEYRRANNGYWFLITPPPPPENAALSPLVAEERTLLTELRGARFIRLLPGLPTHYRRYGFNLAEASEPLPPGAKEPATSSGPLLFDPFDQDLAERTSRESWSALETLFEKMRAVAPDYGAARLQAPCSQQAFKAALRVRGRPAPPARAPARRTRGARPSGRR